MRATRKLGENVPLADDLDNGEKNGVVPVGDSFVERHFAFLIEPHEIMMHFDVLQQIGVSPRRGYGDVSPRPEKIQPGAFEKISEFGFQDEVLRLNLGGKRHPGVNVRDVGLDMRMATLPRHRHAVIAVAYEVGISNLKKLDRRQARALLGEHLDPGPPLLIAVAARQKIARKVVISSNASHNRIQGHILQYAPISADAVHLLTHLLKREKIRGLAGQRGDDLFKVRASARPGKVLFSRFLCSWHGD